MLRQCSAIEIFLSRVETVPFFLYISWKVVRLANAMSRLGGLDDTKHVGQDFGRSACHEQARSFCSKRISVRGMFFEMRKRVNMPLIDKAIRLSDLFLPRGACCEDHFNRSTSHAASLLVGPRKVMYPSRGYCRSVAMGAASTVA